MKNNKQIFRTTMKLCLMVMILLIGSNSIQADTPPPPPAHGETGNQVPGGGAPIGGGVAVLLALGGAYGFKKIKFCEEDIHIIYSRIIIFRKHPEPEWNTIADGAHIIVFYQHVFSSIDGNIIIIDGCRNKPVICGGAIAI